MSTMKHSPLPWRIRFDADGSKQVDIYVHDANDEELACDMSYYPWTFNEEDTKFLIHAVNNYDTLLEALENLENDDNSIPDHAWKLVTDAIAKAKSEAA